MANRVDAPVEAVQAATPAAALDPGVAQAQIAQLPPADDTMLSIGQPRDEPIRLPVASVKSV